jgi:hypothetical protein
MCTVENREGENYMNKSEIREERREASYFFNKCGEQEDQSKEDVCCPLQGT